VLPPVRTRREHRVTCPLRTGWHGGFSGRRAEDVAGRQEGLRGVAVPVPLVALLAGDKAGVDELLHVEGDDLLGQTGRGGEVADAGLAAVGGGDQRQQTDPVPVTERAERAEQRSLNLAIRESRILGSVSSVIPLQPTVCDQLHRGMLTGGDFRCLGSRKFLRR
jgi:hypothetical protein